MLLSALLLPSLLSVASHWWDAATEASLNRAPMAKARWVELLTQTPPAERTEVAYLLRYMPLADLKTMSPAKLAANVRLARAARTATPWARAIPPDIYLDAVLPYANVTEPRDSMRQEFFDRYLARVKGLGSVTEAAMFLNRTLFKETKVTYNTRRLRTDQSPRETIAQGMATCTGLSILLVDACRAVGIPARVAGIHSWPGRGGNHTWVEIWDGGWHFAGAAEPDDKGLDHGWFVGDAGKAIASAPLNSVFAVTYRPTGHYFPLVWAPEAKVNAENVTARYVAGATAGLPRLMVEVRKGGERVQAEVVALDTASGDKTLTGTSFGPHADINYHLSKPVAAGSDLLVVAKFGGTTVCRPVRVERDTVVRIDVDHTDVAEVRRLFADRFGDNADKRTAAAKLLSQIDFDPALVEAVRAAYTASPTHRPLRREFEEKKVVTPERTSPYRWRTVGEKPKDGWGLVIAMHGGGGVPKDVNDSQWDGMWNGYYRDHPEAGGYIYLALRAPNDEWNGFYDDAISPLMERLIRQFVLFAEVDPRRVYTLGASHGGYGAFVIGPKIPYRFAAVHASAAAPTPGETMGENLRNLRFTWMVGENDTAYDRAKLSLQFQGEVASWRQRFGGYPGEYDRVAKTGHFVPDHDKVAEMRAYQRDSFPKHLVRRLSDTVLQDFYWLHVPQPSAKGQIEAVVEGNTITLRGQGVTSVDLRLDGRLVDLHRPVVVRVAGHPDVRVTPHPTLETYSQSLEALGDWDLAAPAIVTGIRLN